MTVWMESYTTTDKLLSHIKMMISKELLLKQYDEYAINTQR